MRRDAPTWAIVMNFGLLGEMANVITHAKFYVNQLRGLEILTPLNLHYSIGLVGRSYNSESTPVLHCD